MVQSLLWTRLMDATKILIVEAVPGKYAPLGIMKFASYLREQDIYFEIVRGRYRFTDLNQFDAIYISSGEFSYYHVDLVRTINYYTNNFNGPVYLCGVYASVGNFDEVTASNFNIIRGVIPELDTITPAYDLYAWSDMSFTFTSRGCKRKCDFCFVKQIESEAYTIPNWFEYLDPTRRKLMVHDNNLTIFGVKWFSSVVDKLIELNKQVIFDNGFDCRIYNEKHDAKIRELASNNQILPTGIRFAYDGPQEDGHIDNALSLVCSYLNPPDVMVYVLAGFNDDFKTVLKRALTVCKFGARPVIQKYLPLNWKADPNAYHHVDQKWPERVLDAVEIYFNSVAKYPLTSSEKEVESAIFEVWDRLMKENA